MLFRSEVGIDPSKMERYRELEKDVAEKQEEMKRIMQVFEVYQKRLKLGGKIDPDKATYIQNAHKLYKQYDDGNKVAQEEMKLILKEMDDSRNGKIIISGTTCAGVTITIARATMRIKDETVRTKFVKDGADIRMESY